MSKIFTMSFDDGLEQDKALIHLMKQEGVNCCTFNLNSNLFGKKQAVERIGKIGFREVELREGHLPPNRIFVKFEKHFRIPEDELLEVYRDVEVCAHGANHLYASSLSEKELKQEIIGDKENLEKIFRKEVDGYVFPYGYEGKNVKEIVRKAGFKYSRGIKSTHNFLIPNNFLDLQPTCSHMDRNLFSLLDKFLNTDIQEDSLFYIWGHGYELDYQMKTASYDKIKRIISMVAARDDVICCNNGEAVRYLSEKSVK